MLLSLTVLGSSTWSPKRTIHFFLDGASNKRARHQHRLPCSWPFGTVSLRGSWWVLPWDLNLPGFGWWTMALGSFLCGGCLCLFACFQTVAFEVSVSVPLEGCWFLVAVFVLIWVVFIPLRAFWFLFGLFLFCMFVTHVIYKFSTFVSWHSSSGEFCIFLRLLLIATSAFSLGIIWAPGYKVTED